MKKYFIFYAGFTLVECLIALSMSSIVMGILIQLYLEHQRIYQCQQEMAHIQENERFLRNHFKTFIHQNVATKKPALDKIFFIRNTYQKNITGLPIPALYQVGKKNKSEALVAGIQAMSVEYISYDFTTEKMHYQTAEQVKNWDEISLIRIEFLLVSEDEILKKPQQYEFKGKQIQALDRRVYRHVVMLENLG